MTCSSTTVHKSRDEMTLREFRENRGVSREMLCIHTGVPYKSLQNWENGRRKAPKYLIDLLKRAIDDIAEQFPA